ncbi:MAG TPA: tRNA 2-thiouridine(34) synthase MnmA [Methylomirabilota bacterium]|nr:tRNA 2-thiouridine(34) synthase MnmA [Methylomirabilota bacterium]
MRRTSEFGKSGGREPIAVAMSGGVDSSTVAAILCERGERVVGLTMQLWDQRRMPELRPAGAAPQRCCSLDDAYDARRVAQHLGIPHYVLNYEARFEETVVRPFVDSYLAGSTPVPCAQCNNHVKFDPLIATARKIGAERLATGHYARIRFNETTGRHELLRAVDDAKDQSYFLYGLTQEQMTRTIFPLGELDKQSVRELARRAALPVAEKAESQEICFVPSGHYVQFIESYLAERGETVPEGEGEIVTTGGEVLGRHRGLHRYTVGQRRGLGVAVGRPLYVVSLERGSNRVIVGEEQELRSAGCEVREVNWIPFARPERPLRARVKIRNRHEAADATVEALAGGGARIRFDEPQRAVTPGQAAVFYDGEIVLGGGWIV